MIKLLAFDLDGTLADSKQPIAPQMAELLVKLLKKYQVAVISGGSFKKFQEQLIAPLSATEDELSRLHLLPTNGTHYYRFDLDAKEWQPVYANSLSDESKAKIKAVIEQTAKEQNHWPSQPWGEIIEDRGSQITFSALGQQAPLEAKRRWDPNGSKKHYLQQAVARRLPEFSVHSAGLTSIDITLAGMNKATAVDKLKDVIGVKKAEIIYIGDALAPGGNDEVMRQADYQTIAVKNPAETRRYLETFLHSGDWG